MKTYDILGTRMTSGYAIRIVRDRTGLGLKEAKDLVDAYHKSIGFVR